jgi:excisionase family DNA binding protein
MKKPEVFTTHTAARLCRVTPMTVIRWIDEGRIKAFRTPGGHRRILRADLEEFCRGAGIPVDEHFLDVHNRILIVDDEQIIVDLLTDVIKGLGEGFEIASAMNGFEAGRTVATMRPQLIFLDLKMPGVDGFAVCQAVKADPATAETEVIAVTGHFTEENVQRILSCGASRVLRKPIDLDIVRSIVRESFGMAAEPPAPGRRRAGRRQRRRKLLIVSNGGDVAATITGGAQSLVSVFDVFSAAGGMDGLLAVGRERPDVVLLDTAIRDVDAADLCRQIRKSDPSGQVQIVAVVGNGAGDGKLVSQLDASGAIVLRERPVAARSVIDATAVKS